MKSVRPASVQDFRALKAVALVMALLLMVPGIEVLVKMAGGPPAAVAVAGAIDSRSLVQPDDPFAALDRVEEVASSDDQAVPDGFSREIGLLPGASEVRVDSAGCVVGYSVSGSASAVLQDLTSQMESRGWSSVPLGGVEGATLVKSEGDFRWALATCTQVGESTSVVVRWIGS